MSSLNVLKKKKLITNLHDQQLSASISLCLTCSSLTKILLINVPVNECYASDLIFSLSSISNKYECDGAKDWCFCCSNSSLSGPCWTFLNSQWVDNLSQMLIQRDRKCKSTKQVISTDRMQIKDGSRKRKENNVP